MKLYETENDTYSLNGTLEEIQQVICAAMHIKGFNFDFLSGKNIPQELNCDSCLDVLKQIVEETCVNENGSIEVFTAFEIVK